MSGWDAHITTLLSTEKVSEIAIHGLDGSRWATSPGFKVSKLEAQTILTAIDTEAGAAALPLHGVILAGERFKYLRSDKGRNVFGKKENGGCCVTRTTKAVLVAVYRDPISAQDCICEIEKLADYFISMQM